MPGKSVTDQQVSIYMNDRRHHSQRIAAARSGFSERTARRLEIASALPSQRKTIRGRTVPDPLSMMWEPLLQPILQRDSAVQAVTLLRHLQIPVRTRSPMIVCAARLSAGSTVGVPCTAPSGM